MIAKWVILTYTTAGGRPPWVGLEKRSIRFKKPRKSRDLKESAVNQLVKEEGKDLTHTTERTPVFIFPNDTSTIEERPPQPGGGGCPPVGVNVNYLLMTREKSTASSDHNSTRESPGYLLVQIKTSWKGNPGSERTQPPFTKKNSEEGLFDTSHDLDKKKKETTRSSFHP